MRTPPQFSWVRRLWKVWTLYSDAVRRRIHGWKVGWDLVCGVDVDPLLFLLYSFVLLWRYLLFYTFIRYTFPLKSTQGICISAISSPLCPGAPSPLMVFCSVGLNCVMRSTMYICRPLKIVDTSKNDGQLQELEGSKYIWSQSSQKLEGMRPTSPIGWLHV